MDPRVADTIDWHSRRLGAPVEIVALMHPGASHVMADGLTSDWIAAVPADRLCLVGQLGGLVIVRSEVDVTITTVLAGGGVDVRRGPPGSLECLDTNMAELSEVAMLWRLLDPQVSRPPGSSQQALAEITARALLTQVLGDVMTNDDILTLDRAVAAFATGSLIDLARCAGMPRPPRHLVAGYLRQVMALGGCRRIPPPRGKGAGDYSEFHRLVPYRWQIAADLATVLARPGAAKELLASGVRWGSTDAG